LINAAGMPIHTHDHRHRAHEPKSRTGRAFAIGIALNVIFAAAEWVLGVTANSLSLIADATHNFSDVLSLALAWGAMALARRPPSTRFTYGLRGTTILAALCNAMLLLVATGGIAWEAILRFKSTAAVNETIMIWAAALGVVINAGTALLFMAGSKTDLNVRGAYLHMAADAGVSLGVVVAGVGMLFTGWTWLDPATSLLIVTVIFVGTWALLRDSVKLALHAAPESVDPLDVRRYLAGLPGVTEVHDLHIWGMSTSETALTVHLMMPGGHPGDDFLVDVIREIEAEFHIGHATIQIETGTSLNPCALAPDHVV
jgi:cobalt-zinc-cadmium efflux system protein